MQNYIYKCFDCKTEYSPENIESSFIYLCPKCGKAEKNKPLEGVLTVEYNYEIIKRNFSREGLLKLRTGKFWLYPELWPIDFSNFKDSVLSRLALPTEMLSKYQIGNNKFFIQDETRNPTLSYKDRASSLVALKAIELGITEKIGRAHV